MHITIGITCSANVWLTEVVVLKQRLETVWKRLKQCQLLQILRDHLPRPHEEHIH